ncbi:SH3 domain-containing protein [Streptomyces sp. ET3-23]|uniref:SH3 domain-containing protein n=1 Tax=Streptomyces sp. ET3-23 TaxID=2885643 RepID=UPI001D125288|nr:SH3 domain-containing protein [Streptomyces sp. ET3-23]MCC2276205.1 SH3 domain-containing protein [Streptomyces sp. ET3-23]
MRATRIAISTAILGALALPMVWATTATAAAASAPSRAVASRPCDRPGPWVIGTQAVTIRSKASARSTAVGVLYRGHSFSVRTSSGGWHYITDMTTGVTGWVSGTYVYRTAHMCLD